MYLHEIMLPKTGRDCRAQPLPPATIQLGYTDDKFMRQGLRQNRTLDWQRTKKNGLRDQRSKECVCL